MKATYRLHQITMLLLETPQYMKVKSVVYIYIYIYIYIFLLLLLLLLSEALELQRSFGLLNECLPFGPVSDAGLPICYFHPCYVALYIILPSIFDLPSDLVSAGDHSYTLLTYHAAIWHTMYLSEPS